MSLEFGLAEWLEQRALVYLEALEARGYSAATIRVYRTDLKRFVRWARTRTELGCIQDIGRGELMSYAAELLTAKSPNGHPWAVMTRNRHLATIRGFFRFLVKEGVLLSDPGSALEGFRTERKLPTVPSVHDVLKTLAAIDVSTHKGLRDRAAAEILYGSGLRISELLSLDLGDVDFALCVLNIRLGKGGKGRMVPMLPEAARSLREYLERSRPKLADADEVALFVSVFGDRMKDMNFCERLKRYAVMAGLSMKVTPHVLRHCCATHLLKGKANIRHIQALLGHESISSTQIYTRVEVSDLVEVVRRCHPREKL